MKSKKKTRNSAWFEIGKMEEKVKTKAKKNPADLTKRNNDARKREIAELTARVEKLDGSISDLGYCLAEYINGVIKRVEKLELKGR